MICATKDSEGQSEQEKLKFEILLSLDDPDDSVDVNDMCKRSREVEILLSLDDPDDK